MKKSESRMYLSYAKIPHLHFLRFLLVGILFFSGCQDDDDGFSVNPNKLIVVATQSNNSDVEAGKEGVKVDAVFTVIFSSPVDPVRAFTATKLTVGGSSIPVTINFNDNESIMGIIPNDSLAYETPHVLTISAGDFGQNGETLETDYQLNFTTEIEPMPLFAGGEGTPEDPYLIATPEQMDIVRLFLTSHFLVINDISLGAISGADPLGWEPIGSLAEPFTGVIDGGGFTVSGLSIQRPEETEVGLFGVLGSNGEIKNLTVQAVNVVGGQAIAALVGRQLDGLIEGCRSLGSISGVDSRAGGLVGSQEAGIIRKCSSACNVFSELSRVGGLVGLSQAGTVEESYASGNCESLSSRVGGVVGSVEVDARVTNSYATGNITARNRGGGAFGRLDGSAMGCYATGNVTITDADASNDYAGHAIGQIGSTGTFSGIFYPVDQTINYDGEADITEDGTPVSIGDLSCASPNDLFPSLDFTNTWNCVADGTWVQLQWQ